MYWVKIIFVVLIVIYVLVGTGLYFLQEKLIFLPEQLDADYHYSFDTNFEELTLEMQDGASINALHFKAENPKGLILYFHGNAGNLARWGEVVEPFVDYQYDVLIVDYRGYGKSTGDRSKKTMLSDAEDIYKYAIDQFPENNIILYGRSLGSSFASHLAGRNKPKMVILESPFYSLKDVAKDVAWMYPIDWVLKFNFKNHRSLRTATCPITILHGSDDNIVPISSSKKLHERLHRKNVVFNSIENGGHNDLAEFEEYWEAIDLALR